MLKHPTLVFALTAAVLGLAACDTRYDFSLRPPHARAWPRSDALHAAPSTGSRAAPAASGLTRAPLRAATTHN